MWTGIPIGYVAVHIESELGYFAQPVTIFYDRSGRRVNQVSGPVSAAALAGGIRKILR